MAEVELRDGIHVVPDHLAELMVGLPLHTMSLEEATKAANNKIMGDRLRQAQDRLIQGHFDALRRGE